MNNPWRITGTVALLILLSAPAYAELATIKHGDKWSSDQKESDHDFRCPSNQVLVGRKHSGDENADTNFLCATVFQKETLKTFNETKQNVGTWTYASCPEPKIMTGRGRSGDEEEPYWIYCSEVRDVWGHALVPTWTSDKEGKESDHEAVCGKNQVLAGMRLSGDENGQTFYYCAELY
ncbi:hypothetical protein [Pseudomonas sp. TWI628]|uniref:hypothetical protein n=1 Tax=Pseudomonas sp. TWI628 TaxID=3136788 RepID=UPI00320B7591